MSFSRFAICTVALCTVGLAFPAFGQVSPVAQDTTENIVDIRFEEMLKAAKNGNAAAQFNVGAAYDQGVLGLEKDYKQAAAWYERSARQGFPPALHNLGHMLLGTVGIKRDVDLAVKMIKAAADAGYDKSQADMGHFYRQGVSVEKDFKNALEYYQKASAQGHVESMLGAGYLYQFGGPNLQQDDVWAVQWFEQAALLGNAQAQVRLAAKLYQGEGVESDPVKAYAWLSVAKDESSEARRDLREVKERLSKDEIAEGDKLAELCMTSDLKTCPTPITKS